MLICLKCSNKAIYITEQFCITHHNRYYYQVTRSQRTEYRKKYRSTKKGKEATLKAIRKYETKHPERRNAWNIVSSHNLPKELCNKCGASKVHAHHPDPLDPLRIIFLCPLHHKQIHMV